MLNRNKIKGFTLLEVLSVLVIGGLLIAGALSQFGSADSSQKVNQLAQELSGYRSAVKQLYVGQGGYGTAVLNDVLTAAKRVPSTTSINTATTPDTFTHQLNGTTTVTGATTQFTIAMTNIPTDVCAALMTADSAWASVKVGTAAARTPPITTATASADCALAATQTMTFTSN